jgi:hypothetical protein
VLPALLEEDVLMRCTTAVVITMAVLPGIGRPFQDTEKSGLNDDGFITTWLLLAPIALAEGQTAADSLDREQVKDEAHLKPRAGDKVKVGGKELVWKEYHAKDYFFDFNDFLGKETEDSAGYAVCYIHAPTEMKVIELKTGSDDQAKVYLNGKEVLRQPHDRPLEADEDSTPVTLRKGMNVLVFKVINEKEDWSGCARFVDQNGQVIKSLRVSAVPK